MSIPEALLPRRMIVGLFAVGPALALTACSAILGLEPKSVDDGTVVTSHGDASLDGGDSGLRVDPDGQSAVDPDGQVIIDDGSIANGGDASDGNDGNDGKIDCLGARRFAFYCDGFEAPIGAPWQSILLPGHPPANVTTTARHVAGVQGITSAFFPLPSGTGAAKLRYLRPGGVGPLSLQLSIYVDNDAWAPGDAVSIGGLRASGAAAAELYFVASGTNGGGRIELRVTGSSTINLGSIAADQFRCFEIGWDGATVTAFAGATNKGSAPLGVAVDSAEVGMEYSLGANANAGKNMEYDDAVIAPAPIGCLH